MNYFMTKVVLSSELSYDDAYMKACELQEIFDLLELNNGEDNFEFEGKRNLYPSINEHDAGYIVKYYHNCNDNGEYLANIKNKLSNIDYVLSNETSKEEFYHCDDCGTYYISDYDMTHVSNGDYVCQSCIDDNYFYCESCEEYYPLDEETPIDDGQIYVCNDCAHEYYFYCESCNDYFTRDNVHELHNGGYVCESCCQDDYNYCNGCDELFHNDDLCYCEDDDCGYCENCYPENEEDENEEDDEKYKIYSYHSFNNWKLFQNENEKPPFYIGFENEIEFKNYYDDEKRNEKRIQALQLLYDNLNIVCMSDGSLSNGGFEIISHPQSFNYIMANKDKIKLVWDKLIELGYVSHDSTHCGLHFHITRPTDDEIINRLWFILEFYKKEIIILSRRSSGQIEQWCNFLSDMLNDNERKKLKSYEYVKGTNKKVKRYMALNNTNEKTIELRFFRGTLKFETFMASIEFVNNLMTLCSDLTLDISKISWYKLTRGEFISKYVKEHNINKTEKPKDYTYKLTQIKNKQYKLMDKITKKLFQEYRKMSIDGFCGKKYKDIETVKTNFEIYSNKISSLSYNLSYLNDLELAKNNHKIDRFYDYLNNFNFNVFPQNDNIKTIIELKNEFKKLYNMEVI